MPAHSEQQFSPYSTRQLFDLVADIERYPEFLPWCRAARILERSEHGCIAELIISYSHFTERYTSRVTWTAPAKNGELGAVDVEMISGPFEHLINRWRFIPTQDHGTQIEFFLDFRFRSRMLEMVMGAFFAKATGKMAVAFTERADQLYRTNT